MNSIIYLQIYLLYLKNESYWNTSKLVLKYLIYYIIDPLVKENLKILDPMVYIFSGKDTNQILAHSIVDYFNDGSYTDALINSTTLLKKYSNFLIRNNRKHELKNIDRIVIKIIMSNNIKITKFKGIEKKLITSYVINKLKQCIILVFPIVVAKLFY